MAWFPSATRAVDCAVALQRAMAGFNETAAEDATVAARHGSQLHIRVGINAGEPIAEGDDLFGHP